jgi:hypothetical protein
VCEGISKTSILVSIELNFFQHTKNQIIKLIVNAANQRIPVLVFSAENLRQGEENRHYKNKRKSHSP